MQTNDFASKFLLAFTKSLIENSGKHKIVELEQRKKEPMPQEIKKIQTINNPKKIIKKSALQIKNPVKQPPIAIPQARLQPREAPIQKIQNPNSRQVLTIPKQKIPPKFQNINPVPTKREVDLGNLNLMINNPMTQAIECDGENIPLRIVSRDGRKTQSQITLTKEEIDKVINIFSEMTKIPPLEGVYKVATGNLILMAIISEVIGSKFVIKKITAQTQQGREFPNSRMHRQGIPNQRPLQIRR
jgi:hypothetical protein